jgi:hypothetical protein
MVSIAGLALGITGIQKMTASVLKTGFFLCRWLCGFFLYAVALLATAGETPPGCPTGNCGLDEIAPYKYIIIGRPLRILDEEEMRRLYRWAKAGVWKDFADDEADYLARNRVLLMPTGITGKEVLVHMSLVEYQSSVFGTNELVRYTPRMLPETFDENGRSIHSALAGCVAVLCGAGDMVCVARYHSGVFRRSDGAQMDLQTAAPRKDGIVIDPVSMLPLTSDTASPK